MNEETALQNKIRMALSEKGILNFRNNTGALKDKDGRLVRYGLCKGSSDIIAIKPVLITPEMVGETIGQFVAIEVKTPTSRPTKDQLNFNKQINDKGGIAIIARDAEDIEDI
jgi:hypothetical protein